jgi:hypothetical protein
MRFGLLARTGTGGTLARWRFPGVTWCIATTFSPCPLAQEWQHRILRSPHDLGHLGNLS